MKKLLHRILTIMYNFLEHSVKLLTEAIGFNHIALDGHMDGFLLVVITTV